MAAPVLGGLLIADEVVDIFIPVRFYWTRRGCRGSRCAASIRKPLGTTD